MRAVPRRLCRHRRRASRTRRSWNGCRRCTSSGASPGAPALREQPRPTWRRGGGGGDGAASVATRGSGVGLVHVLGDVPGRSFEALVLGAGLDLGVPGEQLEGSYRMTLGSVVVGPELDHPAIRTWDLRARIWVKCSVSAAAFGGRAEFRGPGAMCGIAPGSRKSAPRPTAAPECLVQA